MPTEVGLHKHPTYVYGVRLQINCRTSNKKDNHQLDSRSNEPWAISVEFKEHNSTPHHPMCIRNCIHLGGRYYVGLGLASKIDPSLRKHAILLFLIPIGCRENTWFNHL